MRTSVRKPRTWSTASRITDTRRGRDSSSDARCGVACRRTRLLLTVSVLVLLVLAAVQLAVTVWHQPTQNLTCPLPIVPRQLPCQALPLGFLEQYPVCANALLDAMNVTNVHVLTYEEWSARPGPGVLRAGVSHSPQPHQILVSAVVAPSEDGLRDTPMP